ncbi:MAG: FprA family A-type flavoprotein [Desulfomonilia bacterium]
MYDICEIASGIFLTGVNDRESDLFESIWPLPRGISYNAYLIQSEKITLVDTVKKTHLDSYVQKILHLIPSGRTVDYLIINHIEPDHSGAIPVLKSLFPRMKIVGNKKTADLLKGFYKISEDIVVVQDGDTLDLGAHRLSFHITPMVHWPETMMTYDEQCHVLFSGDAFGGFGTLDGGVFDDELEISYYENELLRYFSNIIGKFSPMVQKAIQKLNHLAIDILATTHGPVWRTHPEYVIGKYDLWSRYLAEQGVVIAYASMYGNTLKMAEAVARGASLGGIRQIRMHDVSTSHPSYIIRDAWRYKGIILGSCTYEVGLFPLMRQLVELFEEKALRNRGLGIFGTYGWSGGAVKGLKEFAVKSRWSLVEPVIEVHCSASPEQLEECVLLGRTLAEHVLSEPENPAHQK